MAVRTPTTQPRPEAAGVFRPRMMRFSLFIGIVGGLVDVGAGIVLLMSASMASATPGMETARAYAGGILVIALGGTVLATVSYMVVAPMAENRHAIIGGLMIVYRALMLVVGAAMFADIFPMMRGSDVSGAAMVAVGVGMFYSGGRTRRRVG